MVQVRKMVDYRKTSISPPWRSIFRLAGQNYEKINFMNEKKKHLTYLYCTIAFVYSFVIVSNRSYERACVSTRRLGAVCVNFTAYLNRVTTDSVVGV